MTTIRSITVQPNDGSSQTVTAVTPSEGDVAQAGDTLLIIHCNDFYPFANMGTPTVTPTTSLVPVPDGAADAGDTGAHIRSYTAEVAESGPQTVSVTEAAPGDEEKALVVYVLAGADAVNPIDDAAATFGSSSEPQPAPEVSPETADALLICHANSGGGASTASYTSPASMVEQYEIHVGGLSGVGATEQLVASGSTGTRTFTAASSVAWAAVSIAIRSAASGGGDVDADAGEAIASVSAPDAAPEVGAQAQAAQASAEALFEPGASVSVTLISDAPIEVEATAPAAAAEVAASADVASVAAAALDAPAEVLPLAAVAQAAAAGVDASASTAVEVPAPASAAEGAVAGLDAAVVVAASAAAAMVTGSALTAAGPGVQVSAGRMGVRDRRGPGMAARVRRVAAMAGGGG